jgi:glucose/arabinose dehydrogenase
VLVAAVLLLAPASASAITLAPLASASTWGSPPMFLTAPSNDARLFVVERSGVVRVVKAGVVSAQPFLSIPNVDTFGERGLQSIAFAPDYATSGLLYAACSMPSTRRWGTTHSIPAPRAVTCASSSTGARPAIPTSLIPHPRASCSR